MLTRRTAISALAASAFAQSPSKPNLVFLFADDMGWSDTGFNGRKDWKTPNLDRLASQGTVFDRWYTACPLCAPSRAALMTGKYGIHNTVRGNTTDLPSSEVTIAEALRAQGYATALVGKWHKGAKPDGTFTHPLDQGFDTTFGYLDARHAWEHFPKTLWRGRQEVPVTGYSSDILADEAIRFLQSARKPFFLYVPFIEPHFLIEAPDEDVNDYQGKFRENDTAQPYNARYAAMIQRLDKSIGRILKAIDADPALASNTLVVFTSDNGATFEAGNKGTSRFHDSNAPHRGQKRSLEEGGIRVPACVRWPGRVAAGKRSTAVTSTIDILPTFLAAAGGGASPDPAWKVDGVNMLDVWTGKAAAPQDRTLFWEFHVENVEMNAAMRGDFKLLEIGGQSYLYNVREDPQERRPLQGENPAMLQRLKKDLKDWLATAVQP